MLRTLPFVAITRILADAVAAFAVTNGSEAPIIASDALMD